MKRSYQGLSLEIREKKECYLIVVEDRTDLNKHYKETIEAPKNNKHQCKKALDKAKEWLWNMGSYNGQSNSFISKHHNEWIKALDLEVI